MRASPNFRCAELFASDPKPGTPKKVKVYEIMQENEKREKEKKRNKQGKEKAQTFSEEAPLSGPRDANDVPT